MTPYKALWGKKSNVNHLRTIGSVVYARNVEIQLNNLKKKLDSRARKVRLIKYDKDTGQYKI